MRGNGMKIKALCIFSILAILPIEVQAQQIKSVRIEHSSSSSLATDMSPFYNKDDQQAALFIDEPFFKKVTFLKLEEPSNFRERIDRLLYGVITDVAPEYDHYGYEIRRYMATVGNATRFEEEGFLEEQIKNVKTAGIILKYWKEKLKKDMEETEALIEERNETSSNRTTFKYNRGITNAFLVEAESWIENNRAVLEYLQKVGPQAYRYDEKTSDIYFKNKQYLRQFTSLYESKLRALKEIRGYLPFRMMVY